MMSTKTVGEGSFGRQETTWGNPSGAHDAATAGFQRWSGNQRMSVTDLVVAEQFYAVVSEEMAVWIKDGKPDSLERTAELANDYMLSGKGVVSAEGDERQEFCVWRSDSRQGDGRDDYGAVRGNNMSNGGGGGSHGGSSGGTNN